MCVAGVILLAAGCDPCSGISGCNAHPHVGVSGQLLNDTTGRPERGATIDLIRVSGAPVESDSLRTTTDGDGFFALDVRASETGAVIADIVVRPKSGPGYRARSVRISTTTRGGDAFALPPWSSIPHTTDFGEIFRRGGARETVANVDIQFRRTGGVAFNDLSSGVYSVTTSATGFFPLFGDELHPIDAGDVIGDLTIFLPTPPGPSVHRDFRVRSSPEFRHNAIITRIGAGPSLDYLIHVRLRARPDLGAEGVEVDFARTGGIGIDPPNWSASTDGSGNVIFRSRATSAGIVTGDITIKPKASWKTYTLTSREFSTFDADSLILAVDVGVGPGFPQYLIIRANGVPLKGARVDVQRVSGIDLVSPHLSAATNDSGIVYLHLEPKTEGDILADITVAPPAPYAPFTVRGVRLTALDAEVPGGRTLLGDWDVTKPPTSALRAP